MDKTLIEEGSFDLIRLFYKISDEAKKEKLGTGKPPINEIFYWWTRKPLIVGRAILLASTLKNIQTVPNLLNLQKDKRAFNTKPNIETYAKILGKSPSSIKVLDPFAGGGNLIFEFKEMGLDCTAMDYNPVAFLILKSILEYPHKYKTKLVDDVERYCKDVIKLTKDEIGEFFAGETRKPLAYIWAWCIKCPYCNQRIPLVNHSWLVKTKRNKRIGIKLIPKDSLDFKVELKYNMTDDEGKIFTQRGGKAICIRCRNSINNQQLSSDISIRKDREMIVVVIQGNRSKDYRIATDEDKKIYSDSVGYLKKVYSYYEEHDLIPNENIKANRENTLSNYGIKKWSQFFSERQLLVILTILKNIEKVSKTIENKEYSKVITTYLAFCLGKHIIRNCIGIGWDITMEAITHALTFRRPMIIYSHAEINPFEKISGSLPNMLNNILDALKFTISSRGSCNVVLGSALNLSAKSKFDLIVTDPPYADDVQYGELSEFFYVWLYKALRNHYTELPSQVPLEEDISVSVGRFESVKLANDFYKKAMREALKQIYGSLKDDGLLVLFFAHSSTEAWNLLLEGLRHAKLRVVSSYAIHTESVNNMLAVGKTSFLSSIVVACRKIQEDKSVYFEDLLPKIEDKVKGMIRNLSLEELLDLPMTDLLIMTYGKVLEETTQHTILKSYRSDFKPEFENLIKDAREFILKEIVTKLTGRTTNVLGSDMSFYLITKVFYKGVLDSNEALKIAWAYSIDIKDLVNRGVAKKEIGITRLLFYDEINLDLKVDEIDKTNLHQQLLYLESIANREGVAGVKRLVSQYTNFRIQDLKYIINLLIKSYRIRLNKKEVLNVKESKELEIIEGLGDIFNSSVISSSSTLEKFM